MYKPATGDQEFIELRNLTGSSITLDGWQVNGIGYTFPFGSSIPASGFALVVPINPASFRTQYGLTLPLSQIFGPYSGNLADTGERIELFKPGVNYNGSVAMVSVDRVSYNNKSPWPTQAAGSGPSLVRTPAQAYGNDPANWTAGPVHGTPGYQETPVVILGPDTTALGSSLNVTGMFTDLNSDSTQTWTATVDWGDGKSGPLSLNADKTFTLSHLYITASSYTVTVTVTDSFGASGTDSMIVTIPPGALVATDNADTYFVRLKPGATTYVQVYNSDPAGVPAPTPLVDVLINSVNTITINLLGGDDTLTVDCTERPAVPDRGHQHDRRPGQRHAEDHRHERQRHIRDQQRQYPRHQREQQRNSDL